MPAPPRDFSMYDYVVEQLQLVKGHWPTVADESGVSYRTIEKIGRKIVSDPGVSYIERLYNYFRQKEAAAPRTH